MTPQELQHMIEGNARAIQALADNIAELTHDVTALAEADRQAQAERAELRQATLGIANLLSALDSDRPTILRKLNVIENKLDQLLTSTQDG